MTSSTDAALGAVGDLLRRTLAGGRLSPSYLLEGADAETLSEAARAFAAGLLCERGDACGTCRACRRALSGAHLDLHLLGKDKPTVISVAALTPMLERAHMKPTEGPRQVFVIEPADAMEPEGIGRYLKALEEPPAGTVFVLATTRPERLPDTVLSRCRRVRFPPLTEEDVATRLVASGAVPEEARLVAKVAGGSVGRARRMAEAGILAVVKDLADAARAKESRAAKAAEGALSALDRAAADLAAREPSAGEAAADRREALRTLIADVLHVLATQARDAAAGRPAPALGDPDPPRALDVLQRLEDLAAAAASNAIPHAVMLEIVSALRRPAFGGS